MGRCGHQIDSGSLAVGTSGSFPAGCNCKGSVLRCYLSAPCD